MINGVTMAVNIDEYLLNALKEDITGEDVSTNAVMPKPRQGQVELICKEDGIVAVWKCSTVCLPCWMKM